MDSQNRPLRQLSNKPPFYGQPVPGLVAQGGIYATFTIKFLALSHNGATMAPMKADQKDSRSSALERINLRLSHEVLEAIDAECSRRAGSVSRNTWITEAVTERLARLASSSRPQGAGGTNG